MAGEERLAEWRTFKHTALGFTHPKGNRTAMVRIDHTDMGEGGDAFQGTHWTQILSSQTMHEGRRKAVLNELITSYWRPVYCYLRHKGHDNEAAKDLVQGFFHEVVLGRELIQQADPLKGRFRTFLLTALDRYVVSVHRSESAAKRKPDTQLLHLDGIAWDDVRQPSHAATPEDTFNCAWASALLDDVLAALERECAEAGKTRDWEFFCARVLNPILANEEAASVSDLCLRYGIEGERKAWDVIGTMKRRFEAALRRHVRPFVDSDREIDQEIRDLIEIFSKKGTG